MNFVRINKIIIPFLNFFSLVQKMLEKPESFFFIQIRIKIIVQKSFVKFKIFFYDTDDILSDR